MKTDFMFQGMMVPVLTPFNDDKVRSVNYDMIDKYCNHLKTMGMTGIMVNGFTAEGMTMTMDERMKLAEKWHECSRKYDMRMLLNIGGMDLPDVYALAEHAERMQVDAVMLMPDLFYRPRCEEDMMMYMKDVMTRCPTRPMFYYHIPMMTCFRMDMHRWLMMMEKECPMFSGIFWADDKTDQMMMMKHFHPNYHYIMAVMTHMMGCMADGMDSMSAMIMNLYPEMFKQMWDHMMNMRMQDAMMVRDKMMKCFWDMMMNGQNMDMMQMMKMEWDKMHPEMKMGPMRMPQMTWRMSWMPMGHRY